VPQPPVSDEIAAALARFYFGGAGPSHSKLSTAFTAGGYADAAPYDRGNVSSPNKETRVLQTIRAAVRRPDGARRLIDGLLVDLRVDGYFNGAEERRDTVRAAQRAFARSGWTLTDAGHLTPAGSIDLTTGGRDALDEQVSRLRRATDDPGQLLGSAKDLLEAVAKFVLEEVGIPLTGNPSFSHLWHIARERLGILPEQVAADAPGARHIKTVLQSSWKIAEQVNELRCVQGTGLGRTLPTGVTAEMALLIVREACSVAEFALTTLDRLYGR
jgi:hypothetical protein